jgi:hypothetical protein
VDSSGAPVDSTGGGDGGGGGGCACNGGTAGGYQLAWFALAVMALRRIKRR